MVNANFPRLDQPRPRLDLGGSANVVAERRAREILPDPKAKGKAKTCPEVVKVPETKVLTKEEPPKAIVLCSRCQCKVTLRWYEEIDLLNPSWDRSMQIPMGEGKNWDVAYVSRPRPADVKLREKLRLELELVKAEAVASLEAAAVEEIKLHREWVNGRVVVTAPEEPILELETHLTGAFEAKNSKAEVCRPTKMVGKEPLKGEKTRVA
ncbi:hypothetical protein L3X38_025200 [Prunus dulcis]|uniref:Uncharacterized protein n=1 Tax=Prunus dulcis TaxID=3755 RepID=A0AAD4W360_PRUDU|nr:hypothetical protein L3X38_025200 [Prunus dulcis]